MRKDRKRRHKMIGRQAKQREVLKDYLNKEITITGTFARIKDVVSLNYVGKSILLTNIKFKDEEIQHMWIHQKAINNYHKLKKGDTVVLKGTVYGYSHSYCNKVLAVKYSLENITIIYD